MRIAPLLAIAVVAAVATPVVAVADQPAPGPAAPLRPDAAAEAAREVASARAAAAAGDMLAAAAHFRAADAIEPSPEWLCNVGVAFYKAPDLPRAYLYLGQCLGRVGALDATFAASVRSAFAALEDQLRHGAFAPIDVTVTPATAAFTVSAFDPEDAIVGARLVWLPYGHHTLTARAEGHVEQRVELDITTAAQRPVRIVLERAPVAIDRGPGIGPGPALGPAAGHRRPRGAGRRTAVLASVGTGVIGAGALTAYLLARSAAADAGEAGISGPVYDDRVERARFRQHLAWGLGGAAALGAVASTWLWYRATRTTSVAVDVTADADGATAAIHGHF